jgi:non-heme chloroperoxidase
MEENPVETQHPLMVPGGGNTNIAVYEYGNPEGAEILLVHGYSQSHLAWAMQYEAKELQKFRIVVIDLRGHGASGKPADAENYNDTQMWADDINAVIAAKNLTKPALVGWSYGGVVITDYLHKYGQDKLAGIVFVGAATQLGTEIGETHLGSGAEHLAGMMDQRQEINIPATLKFLRACTDAELPGDVFQEVLAYNMMVAPETREAMLGRDIDGDKALQCIEVPVLIIHGETDAVVLPAAGHYIAEKVGHAKQSWYAETGHSPFMEQPARFNSDLVDFMQGIN